MSFWTYVSSANISGSFIRSYALSCKRNFFLLTSLILFVIMLHFKFRAGAVFFTPSRGGGGGEGAKTNGGGGSSYRGGRLATFSRRHNPNIEFFLGTLQPSDFPYLPVSKQYTKYDINRYNEIIFLVFLFFNF